MNDKIVKTKDESPRLLLFQGNHDMQIIQVITLWMCIYVYIMYCTYMYSVIDYIDYDQMFNLLLQNLTKIKTSVGCDIILAAYFRKV